MTRDPRRIIAIVLSVAVAVVACKDSDKDENVVRGKGLEVLPLGSVRQKAGKVVHAWAWEGDADPALVTSNVMRSEWPRGSGQWLVFPEVDRCAWFDPQTAREKLNPAQAELIDRLEDVLARQGYPV